MPSDNPVNNAIEWLCQLLVGELATTIAVIAVAGIGLTALQGYFSCRKCVQAVAGCALIFGAPVIARSLADVTAGSEPPIETAAPIDHLPLTTVARAPQPYDPYAGASVPQ